MDDLLEFYENNKISLLDYDTHAIDTLYSLIEEIQAGQIRGQLYEKCKEYYEKIDNATAIEQINVNKYDVLDLIFGDVPSNIHYNAVCYVQIVKLLTEFENNIYSLDHVKILTKIYHNMTKNYRSTIHVKWTDKNVLQFINKQALQKKCDFTFVDNTFILKSTYVENDLYTCSRNWKPPTITEYNRADQSDQPVLNFDEMFDFAFNFIE